MRPYCYRKRGGSFSAEVLHERATSALNVLAHEFLSLLAVMSRDGIKQFAVRPLDDLGSPRKLNGHAPIAEDPTVNHREHFRKG